MKNFSKLLLFFVTNFLWMIPTVLWAQNATITEQKVELKTYPFSDPSPVANVGRIYPYFRFDGYAHNGRPKKWKIVVLENPYIKVFIAPQIGGKIWGAIEKESGQAFIYYNHVVKFRDIAMRGPWTSGGIESNFGVIGHAPSCSTPVDYVLKKNNDGSVACVIGAIDLPSRTVWRVTIRLPKDKAWFETGVLWHNPTALHQSYYHWMNGAAKAAGNLQFFFPGHNYIGHDGSAHSWPQNAQGRNLSFYDKNNFGSYKSYHVLEQFTNYFGGYWHQDHFGFGNWSLYGDKPGKKLWIWGLSRQGMIWEDLLTDTDGQYIEMQSGRLFNQAAAASSKTPFKHRAFAPGSTDRWSELWFPVKNTGGMAAVSPYGTINIDQSDGQINISFCPLQKINDELNIKIGGKQIYAKHLTLEPMHVFKDSIHIERKGKITARLGADKIQYSSTDGEDNVLHRPLETPKNFDWNSVQGLGIAAKEMSKQRNYSLALKKYEQCLAKDPNYIDALTGLAEIYYRRMEYKKALYYAARALAIDTYDGDANFIYGVVNRQLGKRADAKDGFSLATQSVRVRSAAYTQLAEMAAQEKSWPRAIEYTKRALAYNANDLSARQVLAISYRKQNRTADASRALRDLLDLDPLNHFARFEKYLINPDSEKLKDFQSLIRNEFPHETYLELGLTYYRLGLTDDAIHVLQLAPVHPVVYYWLAFLYDRQNNLEKSADYLQKAEELSPDFVFPYRSETARVLQWVLQKNSNWKAKYYLALIYWNKGRLDDAKTLFLECGNEPDYAPFYLARAKFSAEEDVQQSIRDCQHAIQRDKSNWRAWVMLSDFYAKTGDKEKALTAIQTISQQHPQDYRLGLPYASRLYNVHKYDECLSILDNLDVLPFEGASESHAVYSNAHLMAALQRIEKKKWKQALAHVENARRWPEHLGAGRPYDVDERLEDYLEMIVREKLGQKDKVEELLVEIEKQTQQYRTNPGPNLLISALALRKQGRKDEAMSLLRKWEKESPEDALAKWAIAKFEGQGEQASKMMESLGDAPNLLPFIRIAGIEN